MPFGLDYVIILKNKVTESLLILDETEASIVIVIFYHFCEETLFMFDLVVVVLDSPAKWCHTTQRNTAIPFYE